MWGPHYLAEPAAHCLTPPGARHCPWPAAAPLCPARVTVAASTGPGQCQPHARPWPPHPAQHRCHQKAEGLVPTACPHPRGLRQPHTLKMAKSLSAQAALDTT